MKEKVLKEIKKMKGSLLGIGIEDKDMLECIENNSNINLCYILSKSRGINQKKFNFVKKGKRKTINIKKIKNHFLKKSVDIILCEYNTIKKYSKTFTPNSIYICKEKLIIYGDIDDLKKVLERYKRYSKEIKTEKNSNSFMAIINVKESKTSFFKDIYYVIKDSTNEIIDYLTYALTN
ncbi:MAG: hypothetical protein IKD77_04395 [Bacilli bacterium]|nr:hypothetical protein [Bacilli bacterium]